MKHTFGIIVVIFSFIWGSGTIAVAQEEVFRFALPEDEIQKQQEAPPEPKPQAVKPAGRDGLGASAIQNPVYRQLPAEDQERVMKETYYIYDYCMKRNDFSELHDCQCIAAHFFDERLLHPELDLYIISMAQKFADNCPDIVGAAGYAYTQCQRNYPGMMNDGVEEFCTCYAQEFAKMYKEEPQANYSYMQKLGSQAVLDCDAKGMPSPINPDR